MDTRLTRTYRNDQSFGVYRGRDPRLRGRRRRGGGGGWPPAPVRGLRPQRPPPSRPLLPRLQYKGGPVAITR